LIFRGKITQNHPSFSKLQINSFSDYLNTFTR